MRFEIDKIFSCNAEAEFKENDLVAITKMVKNFIEQKKKEKIALNSNFIITMQDSNN